MLCLADERCPSRYPLRGNPCVSQLAAVSFPTIPPPLSCSPPRLSPFSLLNAAVAPPGSPFRRVPVKELTSRHQSPHCASLSFALSLHLKSTAAAPPPATQPPPPYTSGDNFFTDASCRFIVSRRVSDYWVHMT